MKSVKRLVQLFEKHQPKTLEQVVRNCRVGVSFLGEGAFRVGLEVIGYPLVLKMPLTDCYSDLHHATTEVTHIHNLLWAKEFRSLRKYAPKIYYFDEEHGITLMRRYAKPTGTYRKEINQLVKTVCSITGSPDPDLYQPSRWGNGNLGVDDRGQLKIIDLGFLSDSSTSDD